MIIKTNSNVIYSSSSPSVQDTLWGLNSVIAPIQSNVVGHGEFEIRCVSSTVYSYTDGYIGIPQVVPGISATNAVYISGDDGVSGLSKQITTDCGLVSQTFPVRPTNPWVDTGEVAYQISFGTNDYDTGFYTDPTLIEWLNNNATYISSASSGHHGGYDD